MAACTKGVGRRSACQAWVSAEEIQQCPPAQRLRASTSGGAAAHECRRVSTAVVGKCPREWAESRLSGQVLAFQGKTASPKVSTAVDTNCPPGCSQASPHSVTTARMFCGNYGFLAVADRAQQALVVNEVPTPPPVGMHPLLQNGGAFADRAMRERPLDRAGARRATRLGRREGREPKRRMPKSTASCGRPLWIPRTTSCARPC